MINIPEDQLIATGIKEKISSIKVIGVGGGGCNAVRYMYNNKIKNVDFLVCNTDQQSLASSGVPVKLQLGSSLTSGLGAGMDPERGRNAALESIDQIKGHLSDGTKMVFVTACLGGGTGTGAAPVIAQTAKEMGILTIGVVTMPAKNDGIQTSQRAYEGVCKMKESVDSLLVIDNQKLSNAYGNEGVVNALNMADEILNIAVKGIAEIITSYGYKNVDFADVCKVTRNGGMALMGIGEASGEDRAIRAVDAAIESPLMSDCDLSTVRNALVNISSNYETGMTLNEVEDIKKRITEKTSHSFDNFKAGIVFDETMPEGVVRVTIVATGYHMELEAPSYTSEYTEKDMDIYDPEKPFDEDDKVAFNTSYTLPDALTTAVDKNAIPIYDKKISALDYESETAIERLKRLAQEKATSSPSIA
ncbi:MAG: cell division protein FtsZ [Bacteroidales bacterium]|nr:cell division protein FtsZ [Bacteroidales bacterium]